VIIESIKNKHIKLVNSLKNRKDREKNGLFVVEGLRFVGEIPCDYKVKFYVLSEDFYAIYDIKKLNREEETIIVSNKVFKEISDTPSPQGILAVVEQKSYNMEDVVKEIGDMAFFIIAEEMNDPGNLGTIIRTADACGCNGVLLTKGSVDVYNPKVLRSTVGSIFHLPIVSEVDLSECVGLMKANSISIFATHLKGAGYPYDFDLAKSCAFLIGNEARGLSQDAVNYADNLIKIPMLGRAESLNASVAAGVIMYEVVRQRL